MNPGRLAGFVYPVKKNRVLRGRRQGEGAVLVANLLEATGGDEGVDGVPAAVGGLPAAVRAVDRMLST